MMTTRPILLSKKEAATLLNISIGLLEKLIRRRQLIPVKLGRRTLLRRDDVEGLAMHRRQRTAMEDADARLN